MCTGVETVSVPGETGQAMAKAGPNNAYRRGRHRKVKITKLATDESMPLGIRHTLIGLTVCTIFDSEAGSNGAPAVGSRLAYITEVAAVLEGSGWPDMACQLRDMFAEDDFATYTFAPGTFEFVEEGI